MNSISDSGLDIDLYGHRDLDECARERLAPHRELKQFLMAPS